MKLKQVKFRDPVDVRGNNDSGCVAGSGITLYRLPNGDVVVDWEASGGRDADQVIVGHSNIKQAWPATRVPLEQIIAAGKPEAKK